MAKTEEGQTATPVAAQPVQAAQPTQQASTPQPTQPVLSYSPAQWAATSHIPIDPALQAQSTHAATASYAHYQNYYTQASYYQQYAAQTATQATATTAAPTQAAQAPRTTTPASNAMETDVATLNDALGSAGVDLRAEEESLQRQNDHHHSYRPYEDRTRKQPPIPSFNNQFLSQTMRTFATPHKVTKIPEDSVNYLALALRTRLQDLVTAMIAASHHRNDTQFDRPASLYEDGTPMWSLLVRSDVAKQLAALEKVEREEELKVRRERKERADMAAAQAAQLAAQAAGGANAMAVDSFDEDGGGQKKKKKKEGPGVTARNMSEDVRKKMSNAVASQAAGLGGKYAWMTAANAATPAKPKPAPAATGATSPATTTTPATGSSAASTWARPYVSTKKAPSSTSAPTNEEDIRTTVTMRDALFVIEKERGHGGGRGAARVCI
ncbi:Transcription initiation factor TFIID subunit 4 [Pleurotus pulmonarius]